MKGERVSGGKQAGDLNEVEVNRGGNGGGQGLE